MTDEEWDIWVRGLIGLGTALRDDSFGRAKIDQALHHVDPSHADGSEMLASAKKMSQMLEGLRRDYELSA